MTTFRPNGIDNPLDPDYQGSADDRAFDSVKFPLYVGAAPVDPNPAVLGDWFCDEVTP